MNLKKRLDKTPDEFGNVGSDYFRIRASRHVGLGIYAKEYGEPKTEEYWLQRPDVWDFTGRTKYETRTYSKWKNITHCYHEIMFVRPTFYWTFKKAWKTFRDTGNFLDFIWPEQTFTAWIHDERFGERPVIFQDIIDCND